MTYPPTYPTLSTAVKAQNVTSAGGNRVSSVASATTASLSGGSRDPSAISDQMNTRKRPSGLRSRGNSPPNKRIRSGDSDRHAASTSPSGTSMFSPPPSRHNSVTGIDVPVPSGPAPKVKNGRRVDHYKIQLEKDSRKDSLDRRAPNGAQGSGDAINSLHRTNSPSSMHGDAGKSDSGTSIVPQGAPPAPSMFPVASVSTSTAPNGSKYSVQAMASIVNLANAEAYNSRLSHHEQGEPSTSGTMSSLRKLKARKRAIAAKELDMCKKRVGGPVTSQAFRSASADKSGVLASTEDPPATSRVQVELKALQMEIDNLKNQHKTTLNQISKLERPRSPPDRPKGLETAPQQLGELKALSKSFCQVQATLADLEKWRQGLPNPLIQDQATVPESVRAIRNDMETLKADLALRIKESTQSKQDPSPFRNDVASLLQFRKQFEEANYAKQLTTLAERIDKQEMQTHDRVDVLEQAARKTKDALEDSLKRNDERLETKLNQKLDFFAANLEARLGPIVKEAEGTGRNIMERLSGLESTANTLESRVNGLQPFASQTESLGNSIRKLQNVVENLGVNIVEPKTMAALAQRVDTLKTAFEEFRGASLARDENDVSRILKLEMRIAGMEQLTSTVKGIQSATGQDGPQEKKLAEHEKRLASLESKELPADLEDRLASIKSLPATVRKMRAEHEKRLASIESLPAEVKKMKAETGRLSRRISRLDNQAPTSESNPPDTDIRRELGNAIEFSSTLNEALQQVEEKVHTLENNMHTATTTIPSIFKDQFEPFQSAVQAEIQKLNDELVSFKEDLAKAQHQSEHHSHVETFQPGLSAAERQQIQALAKDAQNLLQSNTAYQKWQLDMESKVQEWAKTLQDFELRMLGQVNMTEEQIPILRTALRSLEDRYQNITTEAMYQRMVHWITQSYPNAPDFLNQLNGLQHGLNTIRDFLAQNGQQLYQLAQNSQQLMGLVKNTPTPHNPPQSPQKVDGIWQNAENALTLAKEASSKADEQAVAMAKINTSLASLQEAAEVIQAAQKSLSDDLSNEHNDRVDADRNLLNNINSQLVNIRKSAQAVDSSLSSHMEETKQQFIKATKQLDNIKDSIQGLGSLKIDEIQTLSEAYPQIFLAIYQIQKVVKDINANLDGGGLKFEFDFNFNKLPSWIKDKNNSSG